MTDELTPAERAALAPYFTALDGPVFALVNLPEVVKGALFARYSRSPKSLRRLFLDEFLGAGALAAASSRGGRGRPAGGTPGGPRRGGGGLADVGPRQGARHAQGDAPGGDGLERRHLRHRAGVGAAPAPDARPPARPGARPRRPAAGRAAEGHPRLPQARGRARSRRRLVAVSRRDARGRARGGRAPARGGRARAAPGGPPDRLRPRWRGEGRRGRALRGVGPARRPTS